MSETGLAIVARTAVLFAIGGFGIFYQRNRTISMSRRLILFLVAAWALLLFLCLLAGLTWLLTSRR